MVALGGSLQRTEENVPHRSTTDKLLDLAGSQAVLETLAIGVSLIDAQTGHIVYRNAKSRQIVERMNLPYDNVGLAAHMGFLRPDGTPLSAGEIPGVSSLERGIHERDMPIILRCLDGTHIHLLLDSAPLLDENGKIDGAIVTFREFAPMETDGGRQVESERLLAAAERDRSFHTLLDAATRDLSDAAAVVEVTARMVGIHLKISRCAYGTIDPERGVAHIFPGYAEGVPDNAGLHLLSSFGEALNARQKAGIVDAVSDTATEPLTAHVYESTYAPQAVRAFIGVPMVKEGRLVAFFSVNHREVRVWADEEVRFVREVAERTWNILERIAAQRNLEANEAQYRTLVEGLPELLWNSLPDGRCEYISPQWLAYTGRTEAECLGHRWLEGVHPDDIENTSEVWSRAVRERHPYEVSYRIRRHDGVYRWFQTRGSPLLDEAGDLIKWIGVSSDVQDAFDAQNAAEQKAERQRKVADAAYRITHAKSVESILRLSTEEMRDAFSARAVLVRLRNDEGGIANWAGSLEDGRFVWSTVGAMPSIERLIDRTEQGYGALQIDLSDNALIEKFHSLGMGDLVTKESEPPLIAPLFARDGDHLGTILLIYPEGGVRKSEDGPTLVQFAQLIAAAIENERLTAGLEAKVAERTAQILQKVEELEGFSFMVSHDLRAPLRAIVSNARMVLLDEGDRVSSDGKAMLERLARASIKMAELVDDLLEYARLGAKEPRREWVAIAELAEAVATEVRLEYPSAAICVSVHPDSVVECDPQLIHLVLQNLMDNACKYVTPGTDAAVELTLDGEMFVLRDQGIGFDMRYAGSLFKPFSRLHSNNEYVGTGIGLANVRRILERHGGQIQVESEPGNGTTFRFTLGKRWEEKPLAHA